MQKVLWTKGVLLSPQHLQMQDRFFEELVGFQLASLCFFPWGFSRLEIEREALAGGSLALREASGIFPDGMPFEIPRADAAPAPKGLAEHWRPDQQTLTVHLGIPDHRAGGHNVSTAHNSHNTRFLSEVVMRRDENTGLAEKPIQVARKNFRLLAEGESLEGYSTLPIARIVRAPTGVSQLDPHFVPPLVDITASEYPMTLARRLVELLSAKSSTLAGMRRQRNQSLAEFGVSDIANFWLLYTVNSHLPRFRHLFETRRGHPGELFEAMLALAGALTTFSTTIQPRALPTYDHTDLAGCLNRLDEQLRELLETVVPANHVTLPLRLTEPSVYAAAIEQDRYFAAPQIYLAANAQVKQDELIRKAPQLLKVSSADQIDRLIKQALPGVALRHVPNPSSALPIKLDYQYFLLERSGPDWEAIKLARNLAVYVPADFPQPQLELVVMLPGPAR
ncbi:MAG: type VI secretion system baseplate subunit TssK [Gemmatimonadetes bacterium]|nr:type VI secretion system baseplate subunit TssK [Gemmatimonadota bacterium]